MPSRSAPAQNATDPAPVSTTTRTAASSLASASAVAQLPDQRPRQRVASLLAIDGEAGDGTIDLVAQRREAVVGHGPDGSGPRSRGAGSVFSVTVIILAVAVLAGLVVGLARPPAGLHTFRPRVEQIGLLGLGAGLNALSVLLDGTAALVALVALARGAHRGGGRQPSHHRRGRGGRRVCMVNLVGVAVNGGMPVRIGALEAAGLVTRGRVDRASRHPGTSRRTTIRCPCSAMCCPVPLAHEVVSFGDLIVIVGAADAVRELSRRRARRWAPAAAQRPRRIASASVDQVWGTAPSGSPVSATQYSANPERSDPGHDRPHQRRARDVRTRAGGGEPEQVGELRPRRAAPVRRRFVGGLVDVHAARAARRAERARDRRGRRTPPAAGGAATAAARRASGSARTRARWGRRRPTSTDRRPSERRSRRPARRASADQVVVAGHRRQLERVPRDQRAEADRARRGTPGCGAGAPLGDRSIEPTRSPFSAYHAASACGHRAWCRPTEGCRRSPTPTGGRAPPDPPGCDAAGAGGTRARAGLARPARRPGGSPSRASSATAWPYIGGWVIVDDACAPTALRAGYGPSP